MNCEQLNNMDPELLLKELGCRPVHRNGAELLYSAPYRKDNHPSLSVNKTKKVWMDHGTGEGGTMVDLAMRIMNESSVQSMLQRIKSNRIIPSVLSKMQPVYSTSPAYEILTVTKVKSKPLIQYLNKRGISLKKVNELIHEVHYKNPKGTFYSLGFENRSGGYELRNALMKKPICLGSKDISIVNRTGSDTAIFEGFFDFFSYLELYPDKAGATHVILNSVAMIDRAILFLREQDINGKIELYLDHDSAGRRASEKLIKAFGDRVVDQSESYRLSKDLNDHLVKLRANSVQHERGFDF
ncbi:toprim domain-containing protein [Ekhidna sp.]|uniref:toprim domain-containing protein n=1 Tax=Ekhidna sp. TaxID=2608089 RepID=UPI0032ED106D